MDNRDNKSISGLNRSQTSSSAAESKVTKRLRAMGSGMNNAGNTSLNLGRSSDSSSNSRKKVGGVVLDLETIEDASRQKINTKSRRNNVIILVLSLLLVISLVYLVIAIISYKNSQKDANCFYKINSEVSAKWIIEGGTDTAILVREGLATDTIYLLDSSLQIDYAQSVTLTLEIRAWIDGEEITVSGLHSHNEKLVRVQNANASAKYLKYAYQGTITGGGKIEMFKGLDFSGAPAHLNSDNVKIEVNVNIQKV